MSSTKQLGFYAIMILIMVVLAELVLHAATWVSPQLRSIIFKYSAPSLIVDSELLGRAGNPKHPEIDKNGYRNARVKRDYDVIALGDSHTFGASVRRDEAWPNLLNDEASYSVYNMGLGGYGTVHSYLQYEQAAELSPEIVLVAVYFGNDFFDNFAIEYPRDLFGLSSDDVRVEIDRLEAEQTIAEQVSTLFRMGEAPPTDAGETTSGLRKFISNNSGLYGLLRALKDIATAPRPGPSILSEDFDEAAAALTTEQKQFASPYNGDTWRTILTSPYRLTVSDRDDARIEYGFQAAKAALSGLADKTAADQVELMVVLVPTKEYVFAEAVDPDEDHIGFRSLVDWEARNRAELVSFLENANITVIDPLPALRASTEQPYFENADGHPNPLGHEIIARAIDAELLPRLAD
jgi:hypothetical protein